MATVTTARDCRYCRRRTRRADGWCGVCAQGHGPAHRASEAARTADLARQADEAARETEEDTPARAAETAYRAGVAASVAGEPGGAEAAAAALVEMARLGMDEELDGYLSPAPGEPVAYSLVVDSGRMAFDSASAAIDQANVWATNRPGAEVTLSAYTESASRTVLGRAPQRLRTAEPGTQVRIETTNGGIATATVDHWGGESFGIRLRDESSGHWWSVAGDRVKAVYAAEHDALAYLPPAELEQPPRRMRPADLVRSHEWAQRHLPPELTSDADRALFQRTMALADERLRRGLFQG